MDDEQELVTVGELRDAQTKASAWQEEQGRLTAKELEDRLAPYVDSAVEAFIEEFNHLATIQAEKGESSVAIQIGDSDETVYDCSARIIATERIVHMLEEQGFVVDIETIQTECEGCGDEHQEHWLDVSWSL